MGAQRGGVRLEEGEPRDIVDLAARVHIGVERAFGVDDELTAAGEPHDHIGAQAPVIGVDRDLSREIGIGRKARLFEDVAQGLLAPAATRLGAGAESIDELGGLVADLPLADADLIDGFAQPRIAVDAVLLDALQPLLIAFEGDFDGVEQCFQLRVALLALLLEALIGTIEKLLLRGFEEFGADFGELRRELLLGLTHLGELCFESLGARDGIGLEARTLDLRAAERVAGLVGAGACRRQFGAQPFGLAFEPRLSARLEQPAQGKPRQQAEGQGERDQRGHHILLWEQIMNLPVCAGQCKRLPKGAQERKVISGQRWG